MVSDPPVRVLQRFSTKLLSRCLWHLVRRLPLSIVVSLVGAAVLAYAVWTALSPGAGGAPCLWNPKAVTFGLCYVAAGLVWGIHRPLREALDKAMRLFREEVPHVLDTVLDPVLTQIPVHDQKIALTQVKQVMTASDESRTEGDGRWRRFGLYARLRSWIVRRYVRLQFSFFDDLLQWMEGQGEQHVSVMSVKSYLLDKTMAGVTELIRARARIFDTASALIAFLLLVIPAAGLCLAATLSGH